MEVRAEKATCSERVLLYNEHNLDLQRGVLAADPQVVYGIPLETPLKVLVYPAMVRTSVSQSPGQLVVSGSRALVEQPRCSDRNSEVNQRNNLT